MTHDDDEAAARAMRQLARWVLRDGVDSDHLDWYMRELLSARLVELPALCRLEAAVMSRCFAGLPAREVASCLYERACRLEQVALPLAASLPLRTCSKVNPAPRAQSADRAGQIRPPAVRAARRASPVPEFIACVVFTFLAAAILLGWPPHAPSRPIGSDDALLRFTAAATCVFTGMLYACEGARLAWRNSRTRRGSCP